MGPRIKQPLFKKLGLKYNEMDPINKQILLDNLHLKYNETIDKKNIFLEKQAIDYKAMDSSKKEACRERNRANMKRKYHAMNSPQKAKKKINSIAIKNLNRVQAILF